MSLQYDLVTARDVCRELEQSSQEYGIEFASALLAGLGKEKWVTMLNDNQASFLAYLCATPSQRKRKAAWKGDRMQVALSLGALLHAHQAVRYLEIAVALADICSGTSREGVAKVAGIAAEREGIPERLWPLGAHNPFDV